MNSTYPWKIGGGCYHLVTPSSLYSIFGLNLLSLIFLPSWNNCLSCILCKTCILGTMEAFGSDLLFSIFATPLDYFSLLNLLSMFTGSDCTWLFLLFIIFRFQNLDGQSIGCSFYLGSRLLLSMVPVLFSFELAKYHILITAMFIKCLHNVGLFCLFTCYNVPPSGFSCVHGFITCFHPATHMLNLFAIILGLLVGFVTLFYHGYIEFHLLVQVRTVISVG